MNEQRNNGRGIFYGVIGIATLVVAIVGATFAYFTATAANNVITGNMATVKLSLSVTKKTTAEDTVGLIPMSNGMVEAAVSKTNVCIDDNGNPVCQIYKIELENKSSAGQFVDGYVALKGGSGEPLDYANSNYQSQYPIDGYLNGTSETKVGTTMRWAQVFCTESGGTLSSCSTGGTQTLGVVSTAAEAAATTVTLSHIGNPIDGKNARNIRTSYAAGKFLVGDTDGDGQCDDGSGDDDNALTSEVETNYKEEGCVQGASGDAVGVLTNVTILGNAYDVIGTNYIRVSDHTWNADNTKPETYKRQDDVTSALVFNHNIAASNNTDDKDKGIYYIVVWLTENGKNQTAGQTDAQAKPITPAAGSFFMGNVTFISAQGSEVSATFTDYTRVQSNNAVTQ